MGGVSVSRRRLRLLESVVRLGMSLLARPGGVCRQMMLSLFVPYVTATFCHGYVPFSESLALSLARLLSFRLQQLCGS